MVRLREPVGHLKRLADLGVAVRMGPAGALACGSGQNPQRQCRRQDQTRLVSNNEGFIMELSASQEFCKVHLDYSLGPMARFGNGSSQGKHPASRRGTLAGGIMLARALPSEKIPPRTPARHSHEQAIRRACHCWRPRFGFDGFAEDRILLLPMAFGRRRYRWWLMTLTSVSGQWRTV